VQWKACDAFEEILEPKFKPCTHHDWGDKAMMSDSISKTQGCFSNAFLLDEILVLRRARRGEARRCRKVLAARASESNSCALSMFAFSPLIQSPICSNLSPDRTSKPHTTTLTHTLAAYSGNPPLQTRTES
jgi:hypothetical protein